MINEGAEAQAVDEAAGDQAVDRHAALASDARRRVLELLAESAEPFDAATVAARIGLHVTTARFHLEQLEGAGLIRRTVARAGTRGRPRILFTVGPAAREDGAQHELSRALAGALAEDADGGRARAIRAGEQWSADYRGEPLRDEENELAPLVRILDRLGFDPTVEPATDAELESVIELHACPFRDDALLAPQVVCSVHLGLIRGVVREHGHDPAEAELHPFVRPDLCHVRLGGDWTGRRHPLPDPDEA